MVRIYKGAVLQWKKFTTQNTKKWWKSRDTPRWSIQCFQKRGKHQVKQLSNWTCYCSWLIGTQSSQETDQQYYMNQSLFRKIHKNSVYIAVLKKLVTTDCEQHRTINQMSCIIKPLLCVVMNRMRNKILTGIWSTI